MKKLLFISVFTIGASIAALSASDEKHACVYPDARAAIQQADEDRARIKPLATHKQLATMSFSERSQLRRLWLDITGTLPPRETVTQFLANQDAGKWAAMIEDLLASEAYVARWTTFFNDLFLNHNLAFEGVVRNSLNNKLREMVAENMPVNQMIQEVLTTRGHIVGNGKSNFVYLKEALVGEYRLDYLDDQVSFLTESLLGVRTTCISCHDGAYHLEDVNKGLSTMTREQFWGMAAFLSKTQFIIDVTANTGNSFGDFLKTIQVADIDTGFDWRFYYMPFSTDFQDRFGEYNAVSAAGDGMRPARNGGLISPRYLTSGEAPAEGEIRRTAFARILTADRQFARNIVNRVWAHFLGEGFVEPHDNWDLGRLNASVAAEYNTTIQPKTVKLMEWLTDQFIQNNYDLKALIRLIANGPAVLEKVAPAPETWPNVDSWRMQRAPRRLAAEAIVDAFFKIHGVTPRLTVTSMLEQTFSNPWEMPGPNEPSIYAIYADFNAPPVDVTTLGYRDESEYYFTQEFVQSTMQAFNRGQYELGTKRSSQSSIQNALALLNDEYWNFWLNGEQTTPYIQALVNAMDDGAQNTDVITVMFRDVLFRDPSGEELKYVLTYFQNKPKETAVRDLLWVLFNHPDFLYK